ncbi:MAG TPA: FAD/NAD(P)-binding oxidoreductase, partial [Blastocatellia bacterium]|nr:FAD/NAD(P)-binding oxidoreductase [Blastocatellia bacterium]
MKAGNGRRTEGASDETTSIRHMHARSTEREITRWDQPSDLLVVGGGPAGIAAALAAHRSGLRVTLVDDNPTLGGQIWRREENQPTPPGAIARLTAIGRSEVRVLSGARVIASMEPGQLIAESDEDVYELRYKKLVLATGARERFLPFPGWTLPQVLGAGGLQALVKSGWPIAGKRVIVAGSGPLLLEVAAFLRKKGADILLIAEQAPWERLLRFGLKLVAYPAKAAHAFVLTLGRLAGVLYLTR